jgi:hypothetical protein
VAAGSSSIPPWFWKLWTVLTLVAIGWATSNWGRATDEPPDTVAAQWIRAVSNYGIEPAYPPQEDMYVGDVFAIIAGDSLRNILTEPLPTRAIKLAHIDLTDALRKEYEQVYSFPSTLEKPGEGHIWPQSGVAGSVFERGGPPKSLAVALLPDFTIKAKRKALLDTGWIDALAATFNLSRERTTTFKLEGILTYGADALDGERALATFCAADATKSICSDAGLRLQLSNILGEEINAKIHNSRTGAVRMRYTVELGIITRVYLIRRIETEIDDAETAQASIKAAPPTPAAPLAGAPSVSLDSERGSEIHVSPQTFERPIVFGFRSVRYHVND